MRLSLLFVMIALTSSLQAQAGPGGDLSQRPAIDLSRVGFGVSFHHAMPQGALRQSIGAGNGAGGYVLYDLSADGTFALRADVSSFNHSASRNTFSFHGGRPDLDYIRSASSAYVLTSSKASIAGLGVQVSRRLGPLSPHMTLSFNRVRFESESTLDPSIWNSTGTMYAASNSDVSYSWSAGAGVDLAVDPKSIAVIVLGTRYMSGAKGSWFHDEDMTRVGSNSFEMTPSRDAVKYLSVSMGLRIDMSRVTRR